MTLADLRHENGKSLLEAIKTGDEVSTLDKQTLRKRSTGNTSLPDARHFVHSLCNFADKGSFCPACRTHDDSSRRRMSTVSSTALTLGKATH